MKRIIKACVLLLIAVLLGLWAGYWHVRPIRPRFVASTQEYARAHEAFSHFFTEHISHGYVEFPLAHLLETKARVEAIISERPGCIYAQSVEGISIWQGRSVVIGFGNPDNTMDRDAMMAGFKRYVYDSPMIEHVGVFFLPLGGGQGSPIFLFVLIGLLAAPALYLIGVEIKRKTVGREIHEIYEKCHENT